MEGQESLACCSSWGLKELGMTEYCILYIICLYIDNCVLSPSLFKLYAEYIMRNAGLEEAQAGIKIAGRNINNLKYADDTTLIAES